MFEYYENKLAVQANWLFRDGGIMSESNYKKLRNNKLMKGRPIRVLRPPAPDQLALVELASLPERFKRKIEQKVGDPHRLAKRKGLEEMIKHDAQAVAYFANYKKPNGDELDTEKQLEYIATAEVLQALGRYVRRHLGQGGRKGSLWETASRLSCELVRKPAHNLPNNARRLKEKFDEFEKFGYRALVHRGLGNPNARLRTERLERLVMCMYVAPNRPLKKHVHDQYLLFLAGEIDVADPETGELYDRMEFYKKGKPVELSDATISNILGNPLHRIWVDRFRMDAKEFNDTHVPHMLRKGPDFSLSKVSLDDRDLPRKCMYAGKAVWAKAYYAYDVLSGACIGASYSLTKDADLFIDCFVDMFRFLFNNNMDMPMEVEVEHHIANLFAQDLLKAENLFPYVRWCAAGNSQEKHAEHFNNAKKYGYEKRYQEGIGRWYATSEGKRTRQDKVWDGDGMKVKQKVYSFETLVADDRQVIGAYNKGPHRNQDKYKGKSRLAVFLENANPDAPKFAPHTISRYVGVKVDTSIRRSKYIHAANDVYELPHPELMAKLAPNNYKVTAYYMPTPDGIIPEMHVYQGERFIATCPKTQRFNTATAEQTEADRQIMEQQAIYRGRFDELSKKKNPVRRLIELPKDAEVEQAEAPVVVPIAADKFADDGFEYSVEETLQTSGDY